MDKKEWVKSLSEIISILAAWAPVFGLISVWLVAQLRGLNKENTALREGVKMLLRTKLIDKCLHYIKQGSVPPYALETIKGLYSTYLALGDGDPAVGELVARVEKLQIRSGGE